MHIIKRVIYTLISTVALLGCTEQQEYRDTLLRAEEMMTEHPDSALIILDSLGLHEGEFGHHFRMQYLLQQTNARNKAYIRFVSDSLPKGLADYFTHHGTTNERVLAHYLLGVAYSDIGESPKAINSFQTAIEVADTTVSGFNYGTLSSVYSQMATVYHRQLLLTNEIEARKKACHYALRANQLQWALYDKAMSAGAYILLNKKDSAEIILKATLKQFRENGYTQEALRYSKILIYLYTQNPQRLKEAKLLMDQFEAESELFNDHHELPPSQYQFYEYKGRYFEAINLLDSAEYYYRKLYYPGMTFVGQDPMYRGLLSVYSKRHQADSIAKYAQLYCMANDSSIALKDQNQIAQIIASYNYSHMQKEAHKSEVNAYKTLLWLIATSILLAAFIIIAILIWRHNQQKTNILKARFAIASDNYEKNLRELKALEYSHQQVINYIQQELDEAYNENSKYREKYAKSQKTISAINQNYECERARLLEENQLLQEQIDELKKSDIISENLFISEAFAKEKIVVRIRELSKKPLTLVTDEEWTMLTTAFGDSYPELFHDLCKKCNTPQNFQVCFLTALGIGTNDQAHMIGTSNSRISNIKSYLNSTLFNESTSRTLYRNLVTQYNIYCFEKDNTSTKYEDVL